MKNYLLTISENKYDCVASYIIKEKDIPVGTTLNDILKKIVASIIVGTNDTVCYVEHNNPCSYTIQYGDFHYDVVLQEATNFVLDISGDVAKPISNPDNFEDMMRDNHGYYDDESKYKEFVENYNIFVEDLEKAAGIENLGGKFSFD